VTEDATLKGVDVIRCWISDWSRRGGGYTLDLTELCTGLDAVSGTELLGLMGTLVEGVTDDLDLLTGDDLTLTECPWKKSSLDFTMSEALLRAAPDCAVPFTEPATPLVCECGPLSERTVSMCASEVTPVSNNIPDPDPIPSEHFVDGFS
jgi:hypothetical protein